MIKILCRKNSGRIEYLLYACMGLMQTGCNKIELCYVVMKLHLYSSADGETVVIIRQIKDRNWLQIVWNTKTDVFHIGHQLKHKKLWIQDAVLSPDGLSFMYQYYSLPDMMNHQCVCHPPYFTAVLYAEPYGRYTESLFTITGEPIVCKRTSTTDQQRSTTGGLLTLPWIDPRGREITSIDAGLYADGMQLYDFTESIADTSEAPYILGTYPCITKIV
jgi:hypothetical protein